MDNTLYINIKDSHSQYKLNTGIYNLVNNIKKKYTKVAIVCVGTDRSTGDSFGPLVGLMLSKYNIYDFDLYGTLKKPVHALNIQEILDEIDMENTLIIAIDASVGHTNHIGNIGISYNKLKPGKGVGKDLPEFGDICISGIVAMSGFMPIMLLQCAPLGMVYNMAEKTVRAITYALYKKQRKSIV